MAFSLFLAVVPFEISSCAALSIASMKVKGIVLGSSVGSWNFILILENGFLVIMSLYSRW